MSFVGEHFTSDTLNIREDTEQFIDAVLLSLFRMLPHHGISSRSCKFFDSDFYVYRDPGEISVYFSREKRDHLKTILEHPEEDETEDEDDQQTSTPRPEVTAPTTLDAVEDLGELVNTHKMVDPVGVAFPSDYLSLKGNELEVKSASVAKLLLEPTIEDVERENRIVRINPIFRGRDHYVDPNLVFVLMPFHEPFLNIYETLIKPTVEAEGFKCLRSDDIFSTTSVIEDIWDNINKSALTIAEITDNNPNVMYELGICHTIGKNVMMITQKPGEIPFNFRHMRVFPYTNDIGGSADLASNILSVLRHTQTALDANRPSPPSG